MDEEIDLRPYIKLIIAHWPWWVGASLLAGLVAVGVNLLLPKTYTAVSTVVIVRERTAVSLDSIISTEEEVLGSRDIGARQQALVKLVNSSVVRPLALERVSEVLTADEANRLRGINVAGERVGDLILINITASDPQVASKLADAWAVVYVEQVNRLYGTNVVGRNTALLEQIQEAKLFYDAAQSDLEAFDRDNEISLLQSEIAAQQALLGKYLHAREQLLFAPFDLQANVRRQLLVQNYDDLVLIEKLLTDAENLRVQISQQSSPSAAADYAYTVALISINRSFYGEPLAGQILLQLGLDDGEGTELSISTDDLDSMIAVLIDRREKLLDDIATLPVDLAEFAPIAPTITLHTDHPLNNAVTEVNAYLLELESTLTAQTAVRRELLQERDRAWELYQALLSKQREVEVEQVSAASEVRLAAFSELPKESNRLSSVFLFLLAAAAGLFVSNTLILGRFWWQQEAAATAVSVST